MIQYYYYFMIFIIIEFESFFLLLPLRFEVFLGFGVFDFDDQGKRVWKTTSRMAADNDKIDSFPTWNYFPPDRIGFFFVPC